MDFAALFVREIDRGERGSDPPSRQRAGVAVGQDVGAIGENRQAVLADLAAHRTILLPDRGRLNPQPLPPPGAVARFRLGDTQPAVACPAPVARRAPRGT